MKSIFLVNPISARGHLDAYARLYSRALVELGYRVVLVAETDADVPGYLARNTAKPESFSFIGFAEATAAEIKEPEALPCLPSDDSNLGPPAGPAPDVAAIEAHADQASGVEGPPPNLTQDAVEPDAPPDPDVRVNTAPIQQADGSTAALRPVTVTRRIARTVLPLSVRWALVWHWHMLLHRLANRRQSALAALYRLAPEYPPGVARAHLTVRQRSHLVWKEEGPAGILRRFVVVPHRIIQPLVSRSFRAAQLRLRRTSHRLSPFRAGRKFRQQFFAEAGRIRFQTLLYYVWKAYSASNAPPPDLVVFLYLDLMAKGPDHVAVLDTTIGSPWVGILFHPKLAKAPRLGIERYFKSRTARGGIFLVPPAIDAYAKAAPHLKFALVPDVADLELAIELPAIAQEIQRRAKGRKIILQVGSIAPHKGIMTLLDVIAQADRERLFFAFVGEVHWHSFRADEKRLRAFYARPPENVYVHDGYLNDERDYNAVIAACDVIYAVYNGFNSSSNSLTKAAGLRRPILVTRNTLMGKRALASSLGLVATAGDASDILAALNELAARAPDSFGFDRYTDEHSIEKLKAELAEALPRWLGDSPH